MGNLGSFVLHFSKVGMRRAFFVGSLVVLGCGSVDEAVAPSHERSVASEALRSNCVPRRGTLVGGERVRRVAQWPSDDAIDAAVLEAMSTEALDALERATLPVLVSTRPEFAATTAVMPSERWYATWARHDGLTVTLNASGEARVYPHVTPFSGNERVRDSEAFVTQNETIWSVTWIEHGVAYDLGLECESPTMPQCQDGATALALAESLAYVGPREAAR